MARTLNPEQRDEADRIERRLLELARPDFRDSAEMLACSMNGRANRPELASYLLRLKSANFKTSFPIKAAEL